MTCNDISQFISRARSLFADSDDEPLPERIARCWSNDQLCTYLCANDPQAVRLAANCLAFVGYGDDAALLTVQLGPSDAELNAVIENALWMIWMRAASDDAIDRLHAASRRVDRGEFAAAATTLTRLVRDFPDYAEAHHQLAIAHHALDQYELAEHRYRLTITLNPQHYLAHAALGHLAVQCDRYAEAVQHYRRALEIHPGLPEIGQLLLELEGAIERRVVA